MISLRVVSLIFFYTIIANFGGFSNANKVLIGVLRGKKGNGIVGNNEGKSKWT
jgi:hypothetical protein